MAAKDALAVGAVGDDMGAPADEDALAMDAVEDGDVRRCNIG